MRKLKYALPLVFLTAALFTACGEVTEETEFEYYGISLEEDQDTMVTVSDGDVSLTLNLETTSFTFTDADGNEWLSSPESAALSTGSDAARARSNLVLEYSTESGVTNIYDSYTYSVNKGLYDVETIDTDTEKGFNIYYTIGNVDREYYFPRVMTEDEYNAYSETMDSKSFKKYVRESYKLYDINNLKKTDNKEELLNSYPDLAEHNLYVFNSEGTETRYYSALEELFAEVGYTEADYEAEKEKYGGASSDNSTVFNITLELRIENNELVATVPFDSIEYTSTYIPIHLDVLPYFAASTAADDGYMIVPDGCGAVIDFNNGKTKQSPYNSNVYGWDDAELRTEVIDDSVSMFAGFAVVYNEVTQEDVDALLLKAREEALAAAEEETAESTDDSEDAAEVTEEDTGVDAASDADETDAEDAETADADETEADDAETADADEAEADDAETADADETEADDAETAETDAAADTLEEDTSEDTETSETESEVTVNKKVQKPASVLCLVEDGEAYATIEADISGRLGDFNYCFASYDLVHYIDLDVSAKSDKTVRNFEKALNPEEKLSQRYIFASTDSYVELAEIYRDYLIENDGLTKEEDAEVPVVIEAVGAVDTIDQVCGVPTTVSLKLTSYDEAADMVSELSDAGLTDLYFKYSGWFNGGISNTNARKVKLISKLGSASDLKDLSETADSTETNLYLAANFNYIYRDKWYDSYSIKRDSAKFIGREICELTPISEIWFGEETDGKSYYLTKPSYAITSVEKYVSKIAKYGTSNIAFEDLGYRINSDYNPKKAVTRQMALEMQVEEFASLNENGSGLILKGGNDYTLKYADVVTDMWIESKMYNIEDRSIPFYQMAVHGLVDYTGTALNLSDDYETSLLRSIETGAGLYFTVMSEPVSSLADTEYTEYYGAEYDLWKDTIISLNDEVQEALGSVYNQYITNHENVTSTVTMTEYEDGTKVIVNYGYSDYTYDGYVVSARDYIVIGGDK